jgi:glutathione S-transferase
MHYAEGSLMPILVQKLIFDMVPAQSPFFIRPLVSMIFTQLENQLVLPEIRKHTNMVSARLIKWTATVDSGNMCRSNLTWAESKLVGLLAEKSQL